MLIFGLICACGVMASFCIGLWGHADEQAKAIVWLQDQLALERDERRALTEAVARAGKVGLQYPRPADRKPLVKTESYWDTIEMPVGIKANPNVGPGGNKLAPQAKPR